MASGRREGRLAFVIVAALCAGFLYLVNVSPTWQHFGFVTPAAEPIITYVNAWLLIGLVANVLFVFADLPRFQALVGLVLAALGVWIAFELLSTFPFTVGTAPSFGSITVRVVLAFAMIGGLVVIIVALGRMLRR